MGKGPHSNDNLLSVSHPHFYAEIHPVLNSHLNIERLSKGSSKLVWWTVKDCGHTFPMEPRARTKSNVVCVYCSGQRVLEGFNDLATTHPHLVAEWADTNELQPTEVNAGSHKKVDWVGPCGHLWPAVIYSRARNGNSCGICSNRVKKDGVNDFATRFPHLVQEWSSRNTVDISEPHFYSEEKFWWTCQFCKEDWLAKISSRAGGWANCTSCFSKSRLESYVALLLQAEGIEFVQNTRPLRVSNNGKMNLQLDFILPAYMLAIEVQDFATHSRTSDNERLADWFGGGYKQGPTRHQERARLAGTQLGLSFVELWQDEIEDNSFREKLLHHLRKIENDGA